MQRLRYLWEMLPVVQVVARQARWYVIPGYLAVARIMPR
jgi:hypothetical protein